MALKRLKWLKYLFVGRTEGETEQGYWNEKRKKHIANEHSEGIVQGLAVTETSPPSLSVQVAAGRAVDTDGNDPEVESVQELDLTSLVPGSGSVTVYVTLAYTETEVEPYFVDETGEYQNRYVQDGSLVEVSTTPPADPVLELARVELAAGATEIVDAGDPDSPGPNEINLTHRKRSGREVLALEELSDVSPDEAAAFNNMGSPSGTNHIATLADVAAGVAPVEGEVGAARGSKANLDERLDVALGEDGSLKGHGGTHKGDGSDPTPTATQTVDGLMSAGDKTKLDGVEAGAAAAGDLGDAHAAVVTGNPHDLDPTDVGAAPASHVGAGGSAHAAATPSTAGFMSNADKTALDGHIGAGGGAHASATPSLAGFISAADKTKLDEIAGPGTWVTLDPAGASIASQIAGQPEGTKFWLKPGTYAAGDVQLLNGVVVAGTRKATVQMDSATDRFLMSGSFSRLCGFEIECRVATIPTLIDITGRGCMVERLKAFPSAAANRADIGIRIAGQDTIVRDNEVYGVAAVALIDVEVPELSRNAIRDNVLSLGTVSDSTDVFAVRANTNTAGQGTVVEGNTVYLGPSDNRAGVRPGPHWKVVNNHFYSEGSAYDDYGVYAKYGWDVDWVIVDGNQFHKVNSCVCVGGYCNHWTVTTNQMIDCQGSDRYGVYCYGGDKDLWTISDNVIQAQKCIYFYSSSVACNHISITGNTLTGTDDYGSAGIHLHQSPGLQGAYYVSIAGNTIKGCSQSIYVAGISGAQDYISITGNTIWNGYSIGTNDSIHLTCGGNPGHISVVGNTCRGGSASTSRGIYVHGERITIMGNVAREFFKASEGIFVTSSCDYYAIVGNVVNGITEQSGAGSSQRQVANNITG